MREFSRLLSWIERSGVTLLCVGIFGGLIVASTVRGHQDLVREPGDAYSAAMHVQPGTRPARASDSLRYSFQYSVIPGGIRSADELREAILADPVVAQHYSDFTYDQVKFITLDRDTPFYVSYRLRSGVYWTTERLMIHRGERIMTDGANLARSRCGNRLSAVPLLPITRLEPAAEEMDVAAVVRPPKGSLETVRLSHRPFGFIPIVPIFFLPSGGSGFPPILAFAANPAPNVWILLAMCTALLALRWGMRRRIACAHSK
ncbi:MAG: hypothetical protein WA002_02835 [Candidatus Acidiferrales bacterium]